MTYLSGRVKYRKTDLIPRQVIEYVTDFFYRFHLFGQTFYPLASVGFVPVGPENIAGHYVCYIDLYRESFKRSYDGDAEMNVYYKMNLYFTYESHGTLKLFTLFITVKTTTKLNLAHSDKFDVEIFKLSRRGSRSSDNAEVSHFTLLFCRGRQRNVPRIITHVYSRHCSVH